VHAIDADEENALDLLTGRVLGDRSTGEAGGCEGTVQVSFSFDLS
jgi:hypothetical protein